MYSKEETILLKKEFWVSFGQYMKPIPNAWGEKINWINYKTGIKNIDVKTNANKHNAWLQIVLSGNEDERLKWYELFEQNKAEFPAGYSWNLIAEDEYGKAISTVTKTIDNVSIFDKLQWPSIVSFLKTALIEWDEFWCNHKDTFEMMQ